jgi:N-acetylmuramoyl-L-alanine amidase
MVKIITKILVILLLSIGISYANDKIDEYEKIISNGTKDETYRAFNSIKMIYLNSIVEEDTKLQQKSLTAMVKALDSMGIGSDEYKDELSKLNKKLGIKETKIAKKEIKTVSNAKYKIVDVIAKDNEITLILNKKFTKSKVDYSTWKNKNTYHDIYDIDAYIPKNILKKVKSPFRAGQHKDSTTRVVISSTTKPKTYMIVSNNRINIKILNKQPLIHKREIKRTKTTPTINKVVKSNDKLLIYFSQPIDKDDIKFFEWNSKGYNDIYEIKAKLKTYPSRKYSFSGVSYVKVATFKKNVTRVVIHNKSKIESSYTISKNRLYITIQKKKSKSLQTITPSTKEIINYRKGKVIVLDPGHGGKDTGAIGTRKYREKTVVYQIAKKVEYYLKKKGYNVKLTRRGDRFVKLPYRTKYANKVDADIFVSIHANAVDKKKAGSVHGIETYFLSPARGNRAKKVAEKENKADLKTMNYFSKMTFLNVLNQSKIVASNKLAIDIHKNMMLEVKKKYKVRDAGVRKGPFWVLVGAQMPSVLIEAGYISHPREGRRLVSKDYQTRIAKGIANGIDSYFRKNQ